VLWRPTTPGEEVFLKIYDVIGQRIDLRSTAPWSLGLLSSEASFQEFMRLSATIELFLRVVRTAVLQLKTNAHESPKDFGRRVLRLEELPDALTADNRLCASLKRGAEISTTANRGSRDLQKSVLASAMTCYLCDIQFDASVPRRGATVEHLWPLSLGGESILENMIPACEDCNNKRDNAVTWAWGPVQSTFYMPTAGNTNSDLRVSLALAKLMLHASGTTEGSRRTITLKEAARAASPLLPDLENLKDHHHLYFEIMNHIGAAA
jgi:5-methylcytosine-specific restriction endonuclease McrA